MKLLIENKLKK